MSIELAPGEILALAGENGSGKSTLARIIAGALTADEGQMHLGGRLCHFVRPREALEAGVALVSQEPTAARHMSIAENVLLPRLHRAVTRVRRRQLEQQARPYLERVGLGDVDPSAMFVTLKQGQRELAEVAKAIAVDPSVLILDEATTRLPDPERLFSVVEDLVSHGLSVIFITHRLQEIRRLASRAVVLRDGVIVGQLEKGNLSDDALSSMMVGRELSNFFHKAEVRATNTVLAVEDLVTNRYPSPIAVHVRRGEIVGLAGLVGAGRSELLETIAGCRVPIRGRVLVDGHPVEPGSPRTAMRAGIALVPEDRYFQGLIRGSTISANISLSSHESLRRSNRGVERRRAQAAIDQLRIRCTGVDAPIGSLSGGNAQKVVIARCLVRSPQVLLLDEPTRGVDVGAKSEIYGIMASMVAGGAGILMASSDLLELLGVCDRIIVLCEGRVAGELGRGEATEETIALLSAGGRRD